MVDLLMMSPRIGMTLQSSVMRIVLQTLPSNQLYDPLELPQLLEVGPIATQSQGWLSPWTPMPAWVTAATPSIRITPRPTWDPNAMDVDVTCRRGPNPIVCYQYGKTGHTRPNSLVLITCQAEYDLAVPKLGLISLAFHSMLCLYGELTPSMIHPLCWETFRL